MLEDTENKFMLTIKQMLQVNFELTKKFMTDKNAKLDMIYNIKKKKLLKEEELMKKQEKLDQSQSKTNDNRRSRFRCCRRNKVN